MKVEITYPHCDPRVLHAPGKCQFCDLHPEWQVLRQTWAINFTGEHKAGKLVCPSEQARSLDTVEAWPGNRAYPK